MSSIIELQRKLQENMDRIEAAGRGIPETMPLYLIGGNGNDNNRSTNYKSRTASMTREQQDERERRKQMIQRDVIQLFDEGYTVDQVAYFLEGHVSPSEVARIAEYNQRRRKFLMTGNLDLPGQMVGITIG